MGETEKLRETIYKEVGQIKDRKVLVTLLLFIQKIHMKKENDI